MVGVTGVTGVVAWTVSLCLVHMAPDPTVGREGSDRSREPFMFSSRLGLLWSSDKLRDCGGWCGWGWTGELLELCLGFLLGLEEEEPDRWTSLPPNPKPPMLPPLPGEGNGESEELGLSRTGDWEQTPLEVPVPGLSSLHSLGTSSECVGAMLRQWGLLGEYTDLMSREKERLSRLVSMILSAERCRPLKPCWREVGDGSLGSGGICGSATDESQLLW